MDNCSEPNVLSVTPENLVPIPSNHTPLALPTDHSMAPGDPISPSPAGTLESSRRSADACVDENETNMMPSTPSTIYSRLGNFVFAILLISFILFSIFVVVICSTALRDARSIEDQVLSNATGVSLSLSFNRCALLTVVVAVDINTRQWPSTKPQFTRVIRFMDGPCLRCAHYLRGFILGLFPRPCGLRTVQQSAQRVHQ